jgi:hypothetical protein
MIHAEHRGMPIPVSEPEQATRASRMHAAISAIAN